MNKMADSDMIAFRCYWHIVEYGEGNIITTFHDIHNNNKTFEQYLFFITC